MCAAVAVGVAVIAGIVLAKHLEAALLSVILYKLLHDPPVGGHHLEDSGLCGGIVGAVGEADGPVYAPVVFKGVIVDRACAKAAVGYDDGLVVDSIDHRMENLDLLDGAGVSLGLYVVAHLIRFEQENQHTAGEILQRSAEGHTDGDTCRGEEREERACLESEDADDGDDENEVEHHLYEREHESGERGVYLPSEHHRACGLVDFPYNKLSDIEDKYGYQKLEGEVDDAVGNLGDGVVEAESLQGIDRLLAFLHLVGNGLVGAGHELIYL